ncbi:MAG TPA: pyridoxine 5'-phosphate synthase [Candidatus Binataceae bacterium]|nr:pyridoxine 5'-phosphate synthase [Candidatus Binataceae bacterium]
MSRSKIRLGVNVDHVATLRNARGVDYPDPVEAALAAERAGASAITVHLREDRRHIQDGDLLRIRGAIKIHLNQEMAPTTEMLEIALEVRPHEVCLVPERRAELTTEGGLDAAGLGDRLAPIIARLGAARIGVSLFVDPEPHQIEAAARLGADFVELHTGTYATLADADLIEWQSGARPALGAAARAEQAKLRAAIRLARSLKLAPNAGHGLNYRNVAPIAALPGLVWLHIGHAIVARAVSVGMRRAVGEMIALVGASRAGGAANAGLAARATARKISGARPR